MALSKFWQWSETAASNTDINSISLDGDVQTPAGVDDLFREMMKQLAEATGGDTIASAATTDLSTVNGWYVTITGTTTITALGTEREGRMVWVKFSGALTLTHNATSLILPVGENITTVANDTALFMSEGSGNWRCLTYVRGDGDLIVSGPGTIAFGGSTATNYTVSHVNEASFDYLTIGDSFDGVRVATDTKNCSLTIGSGRTGDADSRLDFIGDTTYGTYGLRMIRNSGANGGSDIISRGTGALAIKNTEAANIELYTTNAKRVTVSADTLSLHDSFSAIEVGTGRTVNGNAVVDLVGDTTYTDYGLRLIRSTGPNAGSTITSRGTGSLDIKTEEAASVRVITSGTVRGTFDTSGNLLLTAALQGTAGAGSGGEVQARSGNIWSADWTGAQLDFYIDDVNVKTFVIDHPVDAERYLVHACIEGPEAQVIYNGSGQLVDGSAEIVLPDYFDALTEPGSAVVLLQPILATVSGPGDKQIQGAAHLACSEVTNGRFTVAAIGGLPVNDQKFFWEVKATRKNTAFDVEPLKATTTVAGDGPYTYVAG